MLSSWKRNQLRQKMQWILMLFFVCVNRVRNLVPKIDRCTQFNRAHCSHITYNFIYLKQRITLVRVNKPRCFTDVFFFLALFTKIWHSVRLFRLPLKCIYFHAVCVCVCVMLPSDIWNNLSFSIFRLVREHRHTSVSTVHGRLSHCFSMHFDLNRYFQ